MFTVIPNHAELALKRLLSQYQDSDNLKSFIRAIIGPVQSIEYVLNDLNIYRQLAFAEGVQLDLIGTIVGLPRPSGATDEEYRQILYGQIGINVSEGQPEQVIQTFKIFTSVPLVLFDEHFPAEFSIESIYEFPDQASIDSMITLMEKVGPAGVRCDGIVTFDPIIPFSFDGALFGSGFGDDTDPSQGGKFPLLNLRDGEFAFDGSDSLAEGFGSTDDPLVGGQLIPYDLPPTFFNAVVPSAGDQVRVQLMGVAQAPLLPASGVTGFIVKVNTIPATISSAVVEYNSQILLEISSPVILSGDTVTIEYSPGNVTDSHDNALEAFSAQSVINESTM